MNRTPGVKVRRALSREVGFGCPVPDCGSPYLEWHHFDPPWHVRNHQEPSGMIALCSYHHPKADGGAFTNEQLHEFKRNGAKNREAIKGRFDWLRNKLLIVLGGSFFFEVDTILRLQGVPYIWLRRDENGYLLLNLRMLTQTTEPRLFLEDNNWLERGEPINFQCPPSGKLIEASYSNGDKIKIKFVEVTSQAELEIRYPKSNLPLWNENISDDRELVRLPITTVEITGEVGGENIKFSPDSLNIGNFRVNAGFVHGGSIGSNTCAINITQVPPVKDR